MTTAQRIFDLAMYLMDEVNETTGATDTGDTKEYKNRTLGILNIMRGELYPYSDTYAADDDGYRPIVGEISDFDTPIDLDDYLCQSVMPYGLAAHLLLDENPSAANTFLQRYSELMARAARGMPTMSEDIVDVYGGLDTPYNHFGRW